MSDALVIIPTYNEIENIERLIRNIFSLQREFDVLVIDDNSPDHTALVVKSLTEKFPDRLFLKQRKGKMGLGTAYINGFKWALNKDYEFIFEMDADFSHNPRYIPAMVEMSKNKHVVIGSRYVPGGGQANCSWKRVMLSKGANLVAKILLGLKAKDTTAGFRLYRREVLESIPLDQIFSSGYSFLVEMLFMCQRRGWQIGEVPIIFEDRRAGTTKISKNEVFKAQYTVFRLFLRRLRGTEPRQPAVPVAP